MWQRGEKKLECEIKNRIPAQRLANKGLSPNWFITCIRLTKKDKLPLP
jgi:hypothetical protein